MDGHNSTLRPVSDPGTFPKRPLGIDPGRLSAVIPPADKSVPRPILVVDDYLPQLALCKLMLRKLPHPILAAQNAEHALTLLNEYVPALIILDIAMPGINGVELLKMICSNQRYYSTKIILATAVANLVSSSERRLADRLLTKPFAYRDLTDAVNELLNL